MVLAISPAHHVLLREQSGRGRFLLCLSFGKGFNNLSNIEHEKFVWLAS
jgi:hypothetical protein